MHKDADIHWMSKRCIKLLRLKIYEEIIADKGNAKILKRNKKSAEIPRNVKQRWIRIYRNGI